MAKKSYSDDLLDPRWQKRRLEILQRDDFTCHGCYDTESTLHVHHLYYVKGRRPWEYPDFALVTVCSDCHKSTVFTQWEDFLKAFVGEWCASEDAFGATGLYDIANQIRMARTAGFSQHDCLRVILHAITDLRMNPV